MRKTEKDTETLEGASVSFFLILLDQKRFRADNHICSIPYAAQIILTAGARPRLRYFH